MCRQSKITNLQDVLDTITKEKDKLPKKEDKLILKAGRHSLHFNPTTGSNVTDIECKLDFDVRSSPNGCYYLTILNDCGEHTIFIENYISLQFLLVALKLVVDNFEPVEDVKEYEMKCEIDNFQYPFEVER